MKTIKRSGRYIDAKEKKGILSLLRVKHQSAYKWVKIAFETGLRLNEIEQYIHKCTNVGEWIYIQPLKSSNERCLPVLEEGIQLKGIGIKPESIKRALHRFFGNSFSIHDCRHTFATNVARNSTSFELQTIMGWKSLETASNYLHGNTWNVRHLYQFGAKEGHYDENVSYYNKNKELEKEIAKLRLLIPKEK